MNRIDSGIALGRHALAAEWKLRFCGRRFFGSLSFTAQSVRSRELRSCFSGEQHRSYVLRSRGGASNCGLCSGGACSQVQRGLDNGRALQDLLQPSGTTIHQGAEARARRSKKSDEG